MSDTRALLLKARGRIRGEWRADTEDAALARGAVHFDPGVVGRADGLDDRQSQPRTPLLARARAIDAVEALEHVRQCLGGDADAVIGDLEEREIPVALHA